MSFVKKIKRLQFVDYLIQRKATGSLDRFACKLGISKRNLAGIISEMKELGFPILYDRGRQSYAYKEEGGLVKSLFVSKFELIEKEKLKELMETDPFTLCFSERTVFGKCPS